LSLIWTNWNSDWEWSGPGWIMSSLLQPFISGIVGRSGLVMHVLYSFSGNIPTCDLIWHVISRSGVVISITNCYIRFTYFTYNWIQIWRIWRPQLRWDKFWSYFLWQLHGSVCTTSAFQVSQGSVETIFRWGWKRYMILRQIYSENYNKFYQNCPSFIENITKKHFGLFFTDTMYVTGAYQV